MNILKWLLPSLFTDYFTFSLGSAAAVVGIAGGLNSLMNSPSQSQATSSATQQGTAPWWQSGGGQQASQQLMSLMNGPSSILSDPAFQAFDKYSTDQLQAKMLSQGLHQSGAEQTALKNNTMSNAMTFYGQQTGLLSSLAGLGFNPASGVQAGTSAGVAAGAQQQGGWQAVGQGVGALNQSSTLQQMFNGGPPPSQQSTGLDYQAGANGSGW